MFTWMADAWHQHQFVAVLKQHWDRYIALWWRWLGWPAAVAIVASAILMWAGRRIWPPAQASRDPIVVAVALTFVCMLAFNFLQGLYEPRMVNALVLALFVALARVAQKTGYANWGAGTLAAIGAGQIVYAFLYPAVSVTL